MSKVTLVYFGACPNTDKARSALRASDLTSWDEVNQDNLPKDHLLQSYSSPTILIDGEVVCGQKLSGSSGACTISHYNAAELRKRI